MQGTPLIDVYRQLLAALVIQAGGELRVSNGALNSERAGMELIQTIDDETGDILLTFENVLQEV